ncbi:amidase family protein [Candidatus Poriferisocius sp.]|uniref:amidase family protein n=1 Tax=Candidatus Poriferisocius sp. TaxID=3101276 RepID=UPI003B5C09E7
MPFDPADCDALVPNTVARSGSGEGGLRGVSFVAKDLFSLKGHRSSFGHERWRSTHPAATTTSPVLAHMLEAGADLVGLTKMDQLAYSLIGNVGEGAPPRNALDNRLYCGGSSSGSAAAVAAGLADLGLGTDTAGSIRVPATVCGLHGLRPSHGTIKPEGVIPLAPPFDVVGILGRRASIMADALEVITPSGGSRITLSRVMFAVDVFDSVDASTLQEGRAIADAAAGIMAVPCEEIEFGEFTTPDVADLFARLQGREIWSNHGAWVEEHWHVLATDVRSRLERCRRLSRDSPNFKKEDREEWRRYRRLFRGVVAQGTVVVLPILPGHGPMRDWDDQRLAEFRSGCFRLTAPSSLTGAPQAVFSTPHDGDQRSIGVGLLTASGGDFSLLELMTLLGDRAPAAMVEDQ